MSLVVSSGARPQVLHPMKDVCPHGHVTKCIFRHELLLGNLSGKAGLDSPRDIDFGKLPLLELRVIRSHDGPEQMLQSKAGYIDARPLTASSAKPLATHGRTIH